LTVERKAGFIAQVMHGSAAAREIDDVGDQALSYAEVKALATGNPLIVEKAGVDTEVAKLTRLRTAHHRDQTSLSRTDATAAARAARLERHIEACDRALARRTETRGESFLMTLQGMHYTQRAEAGAQLSALLGLVLVATGSYLGEGFDWPELDTLFLAFPVAFKGRVVQYVGRLLRAHEGKHHVELHDYVDSRIPVLDRMHTKRLPAYATLGFHVPNTRNRRRRAPEAAGRTVDAF
jgi:superfamily II DNA or RNA helicase